LAPVHFLEPLQIDNAARAGRAIMAERINPSIRWTIKTLMPRKRLRGDIMPCERLFRWMSGRMQPPRMCANADIGTRPAKFPAIGPASGAYRGVA
jgi:hypothetical protein